MTRRTNELKTRYSIGEWFGVGIEDFAVSDRQKLAARVLKTKHLLKDQPCPFRPGEICNKRGGVCSLRLYTKDKRHEVGLDGQPITTCPNRFLEGNRIFSWVGEQILGTPSPLVLGEIGFLDCLRVQETDAPQDDAEYIGRIDNVLVHPGKQPIEWCALEIQAVYFSGKAMASEFRQLQKFSHNTPPFPVEHRRPDWRSSGPKRLLPQLQTKVPTIRTWGRKMAVIVDESFFGSLVGLEAERHLSNAEIAWFVVGYRRISRGWTIEPRSVVYTRLDASVRALTGGIPLSREKFEEQLARKIAAIDPRHPLAVKPG